MSAWFALRCAQGRIYARSTEPQSRENNLVTIYTMKPQVFHFGIDTIRLNIDENCDSPVLEYMFEGLSEGSNAKYGFNFLDFNFDVVETYIKKNSALIQFAYGGDPIFSVLKIYNGGTIQNMSYQVTFYGACFYINDLDELLSKFIMRYKNHLSVSRLDLCLDCDVPVEKLWKRHKTQFRKKLPWINGEKIETFYLGAKKGNKKHYICVYDKRLDSKQKGKFHLFFEYLKKPLVTRIEVKMFTKTIKTMGITPQLILDYEKARRSDFVFHKNSLHSIFASCCLNPRSTCFLPLKNIDIAKVPLLKTSTLTVKVLDLGLIDQVPYLKGFITRASRIQQMHIDPIALLQANLPPLEDQVRTV